MGNIGSGVFMKSVLMIGKGIQEELAIPIVEAEGYRCLTTDRDKKRKPDCRIDGKDYSGLVGWADGAGVAGVFTFTEMVESMAQVAARLGLPGVNIESAYYCQNKHLAYMCWADPLHNIPHPEVKYVCDYNAEFVAKPLRGCGGSGIVGFTGPALVQQKVEGTHHDINGLFYDHQFIPLGISDRFFDNNFNEVEIRIPTALPEDRQQELYGLVESGARALGIEWGPVKADAVFDGQRFYLLEMAPRLHGPRNSLMAWPAAGFSPLIPAIHVIAGGAPVAYEVCCDCRVIGQTITVIQASEYVERYVGWPHELIYALDDSSVFLIKQGKL